MQVQRVNIADYQKTRTNQNPQTCHIRTINNNVNIDNVSFKATTASSQTKRLLGIAANIVNSGATIPLKNVDGWAITFKPRSPGEYELGATNGKKAWTYVCNPRLNHAKIYGTFPNGTCQGIIYFPFQDDPEMLKFLQGLNLEN